MSDAGFGQDKRERLERLLRYRSRRAIPRRLRQSPAPLSFAQERLWFLDRYEPRSPFYNVPLAFRLSGALNVAALERALCELLERHEALRTRFAIVDGAPVQVIDPHRGFTLPIDDLSGVPAPEAEALRLADGEAVRPMDVFNGPLFHARLLRLGAGEHALLLTLNQFIADGWSLAVLLREIGALYARCLNSAAPPLPQLPVQYADYAIWERAVLTGETLARELAYWKRQLRGAPHVLNLPVDRPRRAVCTHAGGRQAVTLPSGVVRALTELSRSESASLFMTLLTAYQTLLARFTRQQDILVAAPVAGRKRREIEGLIGVFTNLLVLRADCSRGQSFRGLVGQVRDSTLSAYAHQDLPFHLLVEELRPDRTTGHMPLAQVAFNFQNAVTPAPRLPGLLMRPMFVEHADNGGESVEPEHVRAFRSSNHAVKFDLALFTWPHGDELRGHLEYNSDIFDAETMRALIARYQSLLEAIAADPDCRLADLSIADGSSNWHATDWSI